MAAMRSASSRFSRKTAALAEAVKIKLVHEDVPLALLIDMDEVDSQVHCIVLPI